MIDWHTHILPGIDDGSKDVHESMAMLQALREQGVDTVVATPHFYANDVSVEEFLRRRKGAVNVLSTCADGALPQIVCGAEVRYYPGISRLEGLDRLCIEGTKLLLLEMSMSTWSEHIIREVVELGRYSGMTIILAHVERYMKYQDKAVWQRLSESGVLMQVNASFINSLRTRHKAISMIKKGQVQFIGSDCHSIKYRPPHIGEAFGHIEKKLGKMFLQQMNYKGRQRLRLEA